MNIKKILIVFIIIIVFGLLGMIIYSNLTNYSDVLKINWNIELPKYSIKEIYNANSDSSFHGDGIRYHVFSYKDEEKIKDMLNWFSEEKETIYYSTYSEGVNNWLNEIKVQKENYPNYSNCKYWYDRKNDNSEIVILWNSTKAMLYIVEYFV